MGPKKKPRLAPITEAEKVHEEDNNGLNSQKTNSNSCSNGGHQNPSLSTRSLLEKAYHLNLTRCSIGACKRNCRANPFCWNSIGEKSWLADKPQPTKKNDRLLIDGLEVREEDKPAGLKNLGNTCYANCPIQLLFHIPEFRSRLLEWNPEEDKSEEPEHLIDSSSTGEQKPKSVIGSLLYVFGLLKKTRRLFVDPTPFIESLELDPTVQQDSQEFISLLLDCLEKFLGSQTNPRVRSLCEDLFRGERQFQQTCCTCGHSSSSQPEFFYTLIVNPTFSGETNATKDLVTCIQESVMTEKLQGSDQYFCSGCSEKRDAIRQTKLLNLPKFLFLQVVRFIYDRDTQAKKKLKQKVSFEDTLDMSKLSDLPQELTQYDLFAVLDHKGAGADAGHYVAHIRDQNTGKWTMFDDDYVEFQKVPQFDGGAKGKKEKSKSHISSSTYLIVYARHGCMAEGEESNSGAELPEWLNRFVRQDETALSTGLELAKEAEAKEEEERSFKKETISKMYKEPSSVNGDGPVSSEDWEFVPTQKISRWMEGKDSSKETKLDLKSFVCPHDYLDPAKVKELKCVPKAFADAVLGDNSSALRFPVSKMCQACVFRDIESTRTKDTIASDNQVLQNLLKEPLNENEALWVGKQFLRRWHKLALEKREGMKSENREESPESGETLQNGDSEESEDDIMDEGVRCKHGGLVPEEAGRRKVNRCAWEILRNYFPDIAEFSNDTEPCQECAVKMQSKEEEILCRKRKAADLKKVFPSLAGNKLRKIGPEMDEAVVLPLYFVKALQSFVKNPDKAEEVKSVDYGFVLCNHGLLNADPLNEAERDEWFSIARRDEVAELSDYFKIDRPLIVMKPPTAGTSQGKSEPAFDLKTWSMNLGVCEECAAKRREEEEESGRKFTREYVYVSKMEVSGSNLKLITECADVDGKVMLDIAGSGNGELGDLFIRSTGDPDDGVVRRSNRSKRGKKEKPILVSSEDTVASLKEKIMDTLDLPVFAQTLFFNGRLLLNDDATLSQLKIVPKARVVALYDEALYADDVSESLVNGNSERSLEMGFKGTKLAC